MEFSKRSPRIKFTFSFENALDHEQIRLPNELRANQEVLTIKGARTRPCADNARMC